MIKQNELKWVDLSDPVGTMLERVDINRRSCDIRIGEEVNIPYFKGIFTKEMAEEIMAYQYSSENEGYYLATMCDDVLEIEFLKRAF